MSPVLYSPFSSCAWYLLDSDTILPYNSCFTRRSTRTVTVLVGWARDNVVRMGPWRFDHGAIKCPATQWYGEQEQQALENAAWVTARLPSVLTRIVPDRGHFVIFDDWDHVMDFLLR